MEPGEAIPLLDEVERALKRVRAKVDMAQYGVGDRSRQARIDMGLSIFELQKVVDRLAGTPRRPRIRKGMGDAGVCCDHCGGPANEYGDCLAGSHPW